jgi:branched-chain amino acid transport system substrate-binding protein
MSGGVAATRFAMYRCARMWRRPICCAALVLAVSCTPKQVESPLEKAPPAGISEARELADTGNLQAAQNAYEKFLIEHPGTVEADLARLELGVLSAEQGRCVPALPQFEQAQDSADRAIALRASLHLAACQLELGDPDRALRALGPIATERFAEKEQTLLWETAVEASEQTTDGVQGLAVLDALEAGGEDPPDPQRLWAAANLLAQKVTLEEARSLLESLRAGGLAQAAVAMRLLDEGLVAQDAEEVARAADVLRASSVIALSEVTVAVARADELLHGNPYAIGALLPMSGRGREVGRRLLQGMQLAQLEEGGPELVVEDSGGDGPTAETAASRLIDEHGVIAVLGPVDIRATEAAAVATRRAGAPLLSFAPSESVTSAGEQVYRFVYSPRDEVAALVQSAREAGHSRFVILHPDHGYGRTMERLFDQEVATSGGVTCEAVAYPPGTKSFVEQVRTVLETSCDTILLADVADQVALIAPTFAAEGAWSVGTGSLPEHAEREIQFLLPSPSWSAVLLGRAGRYLQGAWVALPFYEDSGTEVAERFRLAYETRYGTAPSTFAAYGYDAYRMISTSIRSGNRTREALSDALMGGVGVESVTSIDGLSNLRTPATPPEVYRVGGEALEPSR